MVVGTEGTGMISGQDLAVIRRYSYRAGYHLGISLRAVIAIASGSSQEVESFLSYLRSHSHQGFCIEVVMAVLYAYARRGNDAVVGWILNTIKDHRPQWHGHALALIADCTRSEVTLAQAADRLSDGQNGGVRAQGEYDLRVAQTIPIIDDLQLPDITSVVEGAKKMDGIQRGEGMGSEQTSWYHRLGVQEATAAWLRASMRR